MCVSPVAGGRGQPTGRSRPAGGAPHPAAGPGARFPGGSPFRCDGCGRQARTVAAAAGRESGGCCGAEQGRRGEFRDLMFSTMPCMLRVQVAVTALLSFSLVAFPRYTFHCFTDLQAYVQLDGVVAVLFARACTRTEIHACAYVHTHT